MDIKNRITGEVYFCYGYICGLGGYIYAPFIQAYNY
jgi:hypothetical protein